MRTSHRFVTALLFVCVAASWPLGEEGRKLYAGTALYAEDGEVLAVARQTWIAPSPAK